MAGSIVGVNFSNAFQSKAVDPNLAVQQIAALPANWAKTFGHRINNYEFIKAAQAAGTLTLSVGIINEELQGLANGETQYLIDSIGPFVDIIPMVTVGNEPLGSWEGGKYNGLLARAVSNVHAAFKRAGFRIAVTVPQNFEFMAVSYPPSQGRVKPELANIIADTCAVMRDSGAPFMVNVYPFLTRIGNPRDVPLDYCLFTAGPDHWVHDGNFVYKNIFAAMLDALIAALNRLNYGDLEIAVGECGWPTAGNPEATVANAQTFNQNLINFCKSGAGTPRRPNWPIRCFVFEMYDEDRKSTGPGPFEHYWGLYTMGAQPKYGLTW